MRTNNNKKILLELKRQVYNEIHLNQTNPYNGLYSHLNETRDLDTGTYDKVNNLITVLLGSPIITAMGLGTNDLLVLAKCVIVDGGRVVYNINNFKNILLKHGIDTTYFQIGYKPLPDGFIDQIVALDEEAQEEILDGLYYIFRAIKGYFVAGISAVPEPTGATSAIAGIIAATDIDQFIMEGYSLIPDWILEFLGKVTNIASLGGFIVSLSFVQLFNNAARIMQACEAADIDTLVSDIDKAAQAELKKAAAKKAKQKKQPASPPDLSQPALPEPSDTIDITPGGMPSPGGYDGGPVIDISEARRLKKKLFIETLHRSNTIARRKYSKKLTTMFLLESIDHEEEVYNDMLATQNSIVIDLIDLLQRLLESTSIPGSSGLSILVGAITQATYGKQFILGLSHLYYKQAGNKPISRRIVQFTPAAISALLGGPVGILMSPLVGLLGNLIGDALLVLGHSVELMGGIQEESMPGMDQAKDIIGDIVAGGLNAISPISFASIAGIAKNGFEIFHGIRKLQELNTRADAIARTGSRTVSSGDGYDDITIDMGDVEVDEYDDPTIIDVTPGERRTARLPGDSGRNRSLPQRRFLPRPGIDDL